MAKVVVVLSPPAAAEEGGGWLKRRQGCNVRSLGRFRERFYLVRYV